jgi:hypothetical protein
LVLRIFFRWLTGESATAVKNHWPDRQARLCLWELAAQHLYATDRSAITVVRRSDSATWRALDTHDDAEPLIFANYGLLL